VLSKTISKTISKTFGITTDEQLIHKALAGSERAWFALVKRYEKRLYNYSLRMTGSPDDAMDVLQDVLMSVYRNLASYRGEGVFAAWLFRIATFRCTDYFRRSKRQFTSTDDVDVLDDSGTDIADTMDNIDGNKGLTKMMSLLPTDQKHVVELKFFQHFTFDEIAGQLGISSNTAKSRLYAALKKMREQKGTMMMLKEGI
jgi:RNA polymerase sigma-70 factor (ECF subfamily)